MSTTWKLEGITELAIAKLEGVMLGPDGKSANELLRYGAPEHLAVVRYGVNDILQGVLLDAKKDAKMDIPKEFNARLRAWFEKDANFLAISSNAKKLLAGIDEGKAYPKLASTETPKRGYE